MVCRPGHLAAFGSSPLHVAPQIGPVDGDLADGDDQLSVQRHQRVELLYDLRCNHITVNKSYTVLKSLH